MLLAPLNKVFKIQLTPELENFRLLQMHFHWRGSEHTLNDVKFAGELHLVHQSLKNSKRFAVLGFFFEVSSSTSALRVIRDETTQLNEFCSLSSCLKRTTKTWPQSSTRSRTSKSTTRAAKPSPWSLRTSCPPRSSDTIATRAR